MTHAETRTVGYALAGSLAVHVLLAVGFALWIGLASFHRMQMPEPVPAEQEPEVTLVFPDLPPVEPVPVTPQKEERYIRTTQNTEAPQAPAKTDFISDKDTVAMARAAPSPDGTKPMPTMQGVDFPTMELANRTYRDGETKNDSAPAPPQATATMATATPAPAPAPPPSPPPTPPPVTPQMKLPEPAPPQPQMAKKEDAPAETMMKELDAAMAKQEKAPEPKPQDQPPDMQKPEETRNALPTMRTPEEKSVPRAIPMAKTANTPRPEKDAFQPETHRSSVKGTISNIGNEDAVAAAATPVGRYMRQVTGAVEKKWHQFRLARADAVEPGKMGLRFYVNKNGKVEDLEFLFKESNALMEDFTIEAILKADIPPIPKDLLPILEKERVEITYDIVIHP